MRVIALVCARGGSKGIPRKNLRLLNGRPLIAWAIARAAEARDVARVIVSTDAEDLADAARAAGAEIPFLRPAALAQDASPEWLVWRHALAAVEEQEGVLPDALLVVPPTAPLRSVDDLNRAVDEYRKGNADVVITVTDAHRNPYFNMVRLDPDGAARLVNPPAAEVRRRQDAPEVYDMTTVAYVARPEFVMSHHGLFEGRVRAVRIPIERALDIDTPLDLAIAECLMTR